MDGESIFTTMEPFMRETSSMEENMDLGRSCSPMAQKSKPTGIKLMLKAKAKFSTRTATFSKANTTCHRSTVRAYTFGEATTQNMKANSRKTHLRAMPKYISLQTSTISVE